MRACLRFAADVSLGYLTAALKDLGSGVKASVLLHLPALSITGSLNAILRDLLAHGFSVAGSYNFSGSNHSGYLFQISNSYAANGSEAEQIERVIVAALRLALLERRCVKEFAETKPTFMRDQIARSYAAARTARFVSLRESMDILARLRLGVNAGYIEGLDSRELAALLYKMKPEYVTRARDYASRIESDVTSEETRSDRTRALILKFALDKSVLLI